MSDTLISVCLITYNHVKYISKAIDSILMQKVNVAWDLIIADDFSTDGTRDILLKYKEKHPEFIKLILQEKNVGATKNWVDLLSEPSSKYIACLEGDDYWIDPLKLQKQVDLLESHLGFVMCFTNSYIVDENDTIINDDRLGENRKMNLTQSEVLLGRIPPTNTAMFRNNLIKKFPEAFHSIINGDYLLFSMLTEYGDAAYLPAHTACYRRHDGGIWSNRSDEYIKANNLKTRLVLLHIFSPKFRELLLPQAHCSYMVLMEYYKSKNEAIKFAATFASYFMNNIRYHVFTVRSDIRYLMSGLLLVLRGKVSHYW